MYEDIQWISVYFHLTGARLLASMAAERPRASFLYSRCEAAAGANRASVTSGSSIAVATLAHPFDTGYSPLSYSGNPGANGVSYRGITHPSKLAVYP